MPFWLFFTFDCLPLSYYRLVFFLAIFLGFVYLATLQPYPALKRVSECPFACWSCRMRASGATSASAGRGWLEKKRKDGRKVLYFLVAGFPLLPHKKIISTCPMLIHLRRFDCSSRKLSLFPRLNFQFFCPQSENKDKLCSK